MRMRWSMVYSMVMVFPIERMGAALVAFHCSIVSLFFVIIAVPFYADIIAHEKMGAYAAITLIDAVLRLGIAIALKFSQNDRLVIYAILLMLSANFPSIIIWLL